MSQRDYSLGWVLALIVSWAILMVVLGLLCKLNWILFSFGWRLLP